MEQRGCGEVRRHWWAATVVQTVAVHPVAVCSGVDRRGLEPYAPIPGSSTRTHPVHVGVSWLVDSQPKPDPNPDQDPNPYQDPNPPKPSIITKTGAIS